MLSSLYCYCNYFCIRNTAMHCIVFPYSALQYLCSDYLTLYQKTEWKKCRNLLFWYIGIHPINTNQENVVYSLPSFMLFINITIFSFNLIYKKLPFTISSFYLQKKTVQLNSLFLSLLLRCLLKIYSCFIVIWRINYNKQPGLSSHIHYKKRKIYKSSFLLIFIEIHIFYLSSYLWHIILNLNQGGFKLLFTT